MTTKDVSSLLKSTFNSWSDHNAPRLGAALAFYMLLSMAPLLIVLVTICGLVVSQSQAQHDLLVQVRNIAGPAAERTMTMLIQNLAKPKSGIIASSFALITWFSGASGVFLELRDSLNIIWDVPKCAAGIRSMVWQRLSSFGMVLALGLLFILSLLLTATVAVVGRWFSNLIPSQLAVVGGLADLIIPLVAHVFLFGLVFKVLPNIRIAWRDALVGGLVTAILFGIGKVLLGFYLGTVGVGSTYGAAGSLVAFVVWVYYSAQIFFFGAIFTKEYSQAFGFLARQQASKAEPATRATKPNWLARSHGA